MTKDNQDRNNKAMDAVTELTGCIESFNSKGIKAAIVALLPNGNLVTRKTDNFRCLTESMGIWDMAKFQDFICLYKINPKLANTSERKDGKEYPP